MEHIYKVNDFGYYTTLEDAVKVGKNNYRNIYKITLNKDNNYQEVFLEHKRFGSFNYYLYNDGSFYDPQDSDRVQEEKKMVISARAESFEKKKCERYQKAPKLGWCDYPEQFAEKCPNFNGVVKFERITRIDNPECNICDYKDYSSKYVDSYYPAIYIGNYELPFSSEKFNKFDGITTRFDGIPFPCIDEIWKFETDRYPFGGFIFWTEIVKKVENGKMIDYTEPDSD